MTYIDTDADVIPAIVERPPTDAIFDPLELDEALAQVQAEAQHYLGNAVLADDLRAACGARHGLATDFRARIAAWVDIEREAAARAAAEDAWERANG